MFDGRLARIAFIFYGCTLKKKRKERSGKMSMFHYCLKINSNKIKKKIMFLTDSVAHQHRIQLDLSHYYLSVLSHRFANMFLTGEVSGFF